MDLHTQGRDGAVMRPSESTAAAAVGGTHAGIARLDPVSAAQRIDFLDALRGFALIGLVLVHTQFFNGPSGMPCRS